MNVIDMGDPKGQSTESALNIVQAIDQRIREEMRAIRVWPDGRTDTAGAARYTGISEKTLMMHRVHGTGPEFVRLGGKKRGRVFYFLAALDEWMHGGLVKTKKEIIETNKHFLAGGDK